MFEFIPPIVDGVSVVVEGPNVEYGANVLGTPTEVMTVPFFVLHVFVKAL